MTSLNLSNEQMTEIISGAILAFLKPEAREELIRKAVEEHLTKPQSGQYGKKEPSILQDAFNRAVAQVAREEAVKAVQEDSRVREGIKRMISEAVDKVLTGDEYGSVVSKLADAITDGLTSRSRY